MPSSAESLGPRTTAYNIHKDYTMISRILMVYLSTLSPSDLACPITIEIFINKGQRQKWRMRNCALKVKKLSMITRGLSAQT